MAELHWPPLIILSEYLTVTTGRDEENITAEVSQNTQFSRKSILENLHLTNILM